MTVSIKNKFSHFHNICCKIKIYSVQILIINFTYLMKRENEAVATKANYEFRLNNNQTEGDSTSNENKSDSNQDNSKDSNKSKLNLNAQSYIPKYVRKPSEQVTTEKPQIIIHNDSNNTCNNPILLNQTNKPVNPTYIPYLGGSTGQNQSEFSLIKV
jgi:hypothetical protein